MRGTNLPEIILTLLLLLLSEVVLSSILNVILKQRNLIMDMINLLDSFKGQMKLKGRSNHTLRAYEAAVEDFVKANGNCDQSQVTPAMALKYAVGLQGSPASYNARIAAMKSFMKH